MRRVLALAILVYLSAANAQAPCSAPDESFSSFFSRFQEDTEFRISRVDWPLRSVDTSADGEVERTWVSREWNSKLERDQLPLIPKTVSGQDCFRDDGRVRTEARYCSDVEYVKKGAASVMVTSPAAPGNITWYRFRNRGGCWHLIEVEGISN
jgi:hypothetical protein